MVKFYEALKMCSVVKDVTVFEVEATKGIQNLIQSGSRNKAKVRMYGLTVRKVK